MTESARELLAAFDALDPLERQQVALEILRRSMAVDPFPDGALEGMAEELFLSYDAEERPDGSS
jgi:hypothetical protein